MAYTTIDDPSQYFHTQLYTGDGSSNNAITNDANSGDFKPDWLWIKSRSYTDLHQIFDSSRGRDKRIFTNLENAEGDSSPDNFLKSFDTDGFTTGNDAGMNTSSGTLVAWQWKCNGGTTSSFTESSNNPGGTIQTNTTAGFSIITTTGTGGAGTIAHGLGAVPHWIISKGRSNSGGWGVYHQKNTSAPETELLNLANDGATLDSPSYYNDTAPTSSVFTVGTSNDINGDGRTYVFYVFTEKQGYSKFGSYTGNGATDGPFVYTGFKPAWLLYRNVDRTENWLIADNKRNPFNRVAGANLQGNVNDAEVNEQRWGFDFLSNGFKIRNNESGKNANNGDGETIIYMAFAEHPFVSSKGVPTTAR